MPDPNVTRIYFYEVTDDGAVPVYAWRFEEPVERGNHQKRIGEVATSAQLPWNPGDLRRPRAGLSPMDIYVASDEVCAFAFHLNATDGEGKQRLRFADPPFIDLPLNATEGLPGMIEPMSYPDAEGKTGRWASFVCDLGKVRTADTNSLASRIRKLKDDHNFALKIPIWFNFVDPELGGSPWVIPTEDHEHDHEDKDDDHVHRAFVRRGPPIFTHGGVHPLSLANLVVAL